MHFLQVEIPTVKLNLKIYTRRGKARCCWYKDLKQSKINPQINQSGIIMYEPTFLKMQSCRWQITVCNLIKIIVVMNKTGKICSYYLCCLIPMNFSWRRSYPCQTRLRKVDVVFSLGSQNLSILVIFPVIMERHHDQEKLLKKAFNWG